METLVGNDPIFEHLNELLENERWDEFIAEAEKIEKSHLKEVLAAQDRREKDKLEPSLTDESSLSAYEAELKSNDSIPVYSYRYRPIAREGHTILHYAMIFGNAAIVEYLLDNGADPMATTAFSEKQTSGSFTIVHCPCYTGNHKTLSALLSYLTNKKESEKVEVLVTKPYQHTFVDGRTSKWLWTPLHYACGGNNVELVNLLIKYGADPMEDEGRCLRYASKVSHYAIVELLIDKYLETGDVKKEQELKKVINQKDNIGLTALHYACQKKCQKTIQLLLNKGGDPTKEDNEHHSPLHYAIWGGAEDCAMTLLETNRFSAKYVIQNFLTSEFFTELIHMDLAQVTIKLLNISDTAFRKVKPCGLLHEAVLCDSFSSDEFVQIVKGLGKHCIEEKNKDGMTPMMLAASRNLHKKLSMIFHAYIELLDESMFTIDKNHYRNLYTKITMNKNKKGLAMAHLAVQCRGSESDFEETVKVINTIWKTLDSMYRKESIMVKDNEKDPFLVHCKCPENLTGLKDWVNRDDITPLELAFRLFKPERAIIMVEVTKGRTLGTVDQSIIHSALLSGIHSVDFERMANSIMESLQANTTTLKTIFNLSEQGTVPLHLALKRKFFRQARMLIKLEMTTENEHFNVVQLKMDTEGESTLHAALENSSPRDILEIIIKSTVEDRLPLDSTDGAAMPQIALPVQGGVEAHAIGMIVSTAAPELKRKYSTTQLNPPEEANFLENLLNDAVKHKRQDIFEMLTVQYKSIFLSTLKLVIQDYQNEEFAMIIVRYSSEDLFEMLTTVAIGEKTIYFNELIQKMPDVALEALNRSAIADETIKYDLLLENGTKAERRKSIAQFQLEGSSSHPPAVEDTPHPLDLMVDLKQEKLLQHTVVKSYLISQWRAVGFWVYFVQVILYASFLGLFSGLVQIVQHPIEERYNTTQAGVTSTQNKIAVYCLSALSMLFWLLQATYSGIIFVTFQVRGKRKISKKILEYFKSAPEVLLELTVFALVFVFCGASIYNTATDTFFSKALWRVGIFAVIFGWTSFVILSSKFPALGEYTLIFVSILKTFLKLAIFGFVLVMASTIVLRMLFYNPLELNSPFFTFDGSIVKLITMITGEIDFQDTFGFSFDVEDINGRNLYDRSMAYFLWILFLVIIPILLSNMLIALAVGDASEIHKNASIKKLELLAYWVTALQVRKKKQISYYLQGCLNCLSKIYHFMSSDQSNSKTEENDIQFYRKKREEDIAEIVAKYSEGFAKTDTEMIQTIKEVTKGNQKKLREMKVSYDNALQKVHNNQAYLMKNTRGNLSN